jgi:uncharacterized surface protein with fasciclin (FAS1) repeats
MVPVIAGLSTVMKVLAQGEKSHILRHPPVATCTQKISGMKSILSIVLLLAAMNFGCQNQQSAPASDEESAATAVGTGGQSVVEDDVSEPNVVKVAIESPDHTTLVTAVQAAELVDVLSNNGPFTVFAPTNAAFDQLPAGTVEGLLKPEKKADLQNILEYHVWVGVLNTDLMKDGKVINQVNLQDATIHVKDGKYMINDANIVATVKASNGVVHVIDKVLLPPAKK